MGNISGVVKPIAVFDDRFLLSQVAQNPKLRKPGDVPDFPERRIDGRQAWADHLLVVEINDEIERTPAKFPDDLD